MDANMPIYVKDNMFLNSYSNGLNISQDIIVCSGGQLNILEGCTIKFAESKKIIIQNGGKIEVPSGNAIILTSQTGNWGGIEFQSGGKGSLKSVTFYNTATPIQISNGTYDGDSPVYDITIDNCDFYVGGIDINNGSNIYIKDSRFHSPLGTGINVNYGYNSVIDNNDITDAPNGITLLNSPTVSLRYNNISSTAACTTGITLNNSYAPYFDNNEISGYPTGILLTDHSSPLLLKNKIQNCSTGIYAGYYSNAVLRPEDDGNGNIYWSAGLNEMVTGISTGMVMDFARPDMNSGINQNSGSSYYLSGTITGKTNYLALNNCWDGGQPSVLKFNLNRTVDWDPYNCTPPEGAAPFGTTNLELAEPAAPFDPPQNLIRYLGNGMYDTLKVTNGSLNLTVDEKLLSSGLKKEMLGLYNDAIDVYKNVITNYRDSASAFSALSHILVCHDRLHSDTTAYSNLRAYYLNLAQANFNDTSFRQKATELANKTYVREHKYEEAITAYENTINNSTDSLEIRCCELNILETYMIMPYGQGDAPSFSGKLQYLRPKSKSEAMRMIHERLYGFFHSDKEKVLPQVFSLSQNYPNPFNPLTKINYSLPQGTKVSIKIFDVLGKLVKELVNEYKDAGSYTVTFDGSNFASGVYFYKIEAGKFVDTKKMVLVK
jgi:parallel beta-helix repeat protein